MVFNEKYGVIQNPRVKVSRPGEASISLLYARLMDLVIQRRTGARPPPPPAVIESAKPTNQKLETKPTKVPERPSSSSNAAPKAEAKVGTQPKPVEKKPPEKKPALRKESSDIFKSFGKTKAPTAKLTRQETDTSTTSAAASAKEDGSFCHRLIGITRLTAPRNHERCLGIRR